MRAEARGPVDDGDPGDLTSTIRPTSSRAILPRPTGRRRCHRGDGCGRSSRGTGRRADQHIHRPRRWLRAILIEYDSGEMTTTIEAVELLTMPMRMRPRELLTVPRARPGELTSTIRAAMMRAILGDHRPTGFRPRSCHRGGGADGCPRALLAILPRARCRNLPPKIPRSRKRLPTPVP